MSNGVHTMELTANLHIEDGSFWADVSELPGCFASGDTLDELLASLQEGVRLYTDDLDPHITIVEAPLSKKKSSQ